MADDNNEWAQSWRKMLGEMEKGFNSFANQAMTSPEFSQAMNRAGGMTAGMQKQLVDLMEKYLLTMNLPSRGQIVGIAEQLQAIEGHLTHIEALLRQGERSPGSSQTDSLVRPRPPRTKRPPPSATGEPA
jgi:hypothetical protein